MFVLGAFPYPLLFRAISEGIKNGVKRPFMHRSKICKMAIKHSNHSTNPIAEIATTTLKHLTPRKEKGGG